MSVAGDVLWFETSEMMRSKIESYLESSLYPMEYEILKYAIQHCGACIYGGIMRSAISGDGMRPKDADMMIPEDRWPDFAAFCADRNYNDIHSDADESRHFMAHCSNKKRGFFGFDVWIKCERRGVPFLDMLCNAFVYRGTTELGMWKCHWNDIQCMFTCYVDTEISFDRFHTFLFWCIRRTTYIIPLKDAESAYKTRKKNRLVQHGWNFMEEFVDMFIAYVLNKEF